MNIKTLGHRMSAVGTVLSSGSIGTGFVAMITPETPPSLKLAIVYICVGTLFAGGCLSGFGKVVTTWEETDEEPVIAPKPDIPKPLLLLAVLLLAGLTACAPATSARRNGEMTMAADYEQALRNDSDLYDGQEKALIIGHTKRMDVELKHDLASLALQIRLEPVKWANPADVSAEQIRLTSLHDRKIADYAASLANYRTAKTKNEAVNVQSARAIRDALNPPKAPPNAVDLSGPIKEASASPPVGSIVPQ